jgi:hypothetical protein
MSVIKIFSGFRRYDIQLVNFMPHNMIFKRLIYALAAVVFIFAYSSCKKETILSSGGQLKFSADTVTFDTVFTSLGSFTTSVKIYNPQNQKVNISSIRLEHGSASYFHLNVNGFEGNDVKNLELAANDSLYVFATVKIDPNDNLTPFVIEDKLIATLNGKEYTIPFIAYGQNANYVVDSVLKTQTWDDPKPYVIMGQYAFVDEGQTLTIPKGCRVYVHGTSRLYVDGTLKVMGTVTDSVVFQGDRLDRKYFGNKGYPGEWGGIYFTGNSHNNELHHAILRNCGSSTKIGNSVAANAAIQVNYDTNKYQGYTLRMYHTVIENSIGNGILSFTGKVYAENCLVHTTGGQALLAHIGGDYDFRNCTFANYGTREISHIDNPTVAILNYYEISEGNFAIGELKCNMTNTVVYGSLENELVVDRIDRPDAPVAVKFTSCLVKTKDGLPSYVTQDHCIVNPENTKVFADVDHKNYYPAAGSPLIDRGVNVPGITDDLDSKPRTGIFDIGAYESK